MWSCILYGTLALSSAGAWPQDDLQARDAVIARMQYLLDDARSRASLTGLAVVVHTGDEIWWEKGDGWIDPRARRAATPSAPLPGGALLSPLTALAVGKLADQRKLRLDDELGKYFPELGGERPKVTLRQVLAHASGLPPCCAWADARARAGLPTTRADVLAWIAGQPLDFAPGTCFAFSSSNVLVAGWLVERLAEQDFATFVRGDLLGPLALDTLRKSGAPPDGEEGSETLCEVAGELGSLGRTGVLLGGQSLCTSARDLARLARAIARGEVVSAEVWRELATPYRLANGEPSGLGLGFDVSTLGGQATVGFGGSAYGVALHATYYPECDLALALVAPGERASLDLVERRLARVFLDLAEPEVLDLPLSPEERVPYLGGYYIGCNRVVVGEADERLTLSLPERERLVLFYQGAHAFVADGDPEVRVVFELQDGRAERFVLEERGTRTLAVRID